MLTKRFNLILIPILIAISGLASLLAAKALPPEIIVHWDSLGRPDGHLLKSLGLALEPLLASGLFILYFLISTTRLGFKGRGVAAEWQALVAVIFAFLTYLHFLTLAWNLHPYAFSIIRALVPGFAVLLFASGEVLRHFKPASSEGRGTWRDQIKETRFCSLAGRAIQVLAGVLLCGLLFPTYIFTIWLFLFGLVILVLAIYSFLSKKKISG